MIATYDTVSDAVKQLQARGYLTDFNLEFDCITCNSKPIKLSPEEFEITEVHRFEGPSDPADEAIVYAIESKHGIKGILVDGYGNSSEPISEDMVQKLRVRH